MAPVVETPLKIIQDHISGHKVFVFSKSFCPFCEKVKELFSTQSIPFKSLELDRIGNGQEIQKALADITGQNTVPNVFVSGQHLGGCDTTFEAHTSGRLRTMMTQGAGDDAQYDYDLLVIGGGSGGLSCSKEARSLGFRVAVCDFVQPSTQGTTWGLGGTCVNVGCIPKKLMHQAALLGEAVKDAESFGWNVKQEGHNWEVMVESVQNHIKSLNWGYKTQLRQKDVVYLNAYARMVDPHTIKTVDKKGVEKQVTARYVVLATGGRPRVPDDVPGAKEHAITSDDVFSLPQSPGKTLIVGASYIALECAGFLRGLGLDVTVMVRSILLRGFDQQVAELIGDHMKGHGVKFLRPCVPLSIEKLEDGPPKRLKVTARGEDGAEVVDEYNTVLFAIGRTACTRGLGLEDIGVKLSKKDDKVICNEAEQTSLSNVYAIGDILSDKLELTPVAIQAGKLLARRLVNGASILTDYTNVATTVFTPLEYGCIGLSEEAAIERYGQDDIEVYHQSFTALEHTVPGRDDNSCYGKLICVKSQEYKVVGFHVLGPHAGEITQGYAVAMRLGARKWDFDATIGIHPTVSEQFTTISVTKSSGENAKSSGC